MICDLIKLGGSVLTDKREPLVLRREALARICREIADGISAERWQTGAGLVLVHGAGSFGHPRAFEYGLSAETSSPRSRPSLRHSVVTIQSEVRRLHLALLEALVEAGVPAVSLPGAGYLRLGNGRLERPDLTELLRASAQGLVPLTCGDVIIDPARGPLIVSGDRVMLEICRQAEPERIAFVTDVEGVYDRDPRQPGARLLPELRLGKAPDGGSGSDLTGSHPELHGPVHPGDPALSRADPAREVTPEQAQAQAQAQDVTGSMLGKLDAISKIADGRRKILVLSGLEPGRLQAHLQGEVVPGTRVEGTPPC